MTRVRLSLTIVVMGLAGCAMPPRTADERVSAQLATLAPAPQRPWADDGPAVPAHADPIGTPEHAGDAGMSGKAGDAGTPEHAGDAGMSARDEDAGMPPPPVGADDPMLQALIAQALRHNDDVEAARARLDVARMARGLAEQRRWPTPGFAVRQSESAGGGGRVGGERFSQTSASLTLAQPLDIGGELSRRAQAAHAQTVALEFAREDVQRRLVVEVSGAYWRIAYLDREAALRDAALRDALQLASLVQTRHRLGEVSGDDVARAARQVAARRGACAAIAGEQAGARHALRRLLAVADPAAAPLRDRFTLPEVARLPAIDPGLPAHLLARRPDLRAQEWRLRETARLVDATHASFYPRMALTGSLGTASDSLSNWLRHPVATLIAELSFPVLEWRARPWRIGAADAQARLALSEFAHTLHQALREVEDGLSGRRRHLAERAAMQTRLAAAAREAELACARYRAGETGIAPWLERRAARRDAEATLLRLRYDLAVDAVTLQQALGGALIPIKESAGPG
ncbi:MAG: TolC family protein [Janthinobacterium lividum]